jgi:hypothetical protein
VRKVLLVALAVLVAAALALPASAGPSVRAALTAQAQPSDQLQSANGEYVVAYADGASTAAARAAVKAAGGIILKENARVGVATVRSSNPAFVRARPASAPWWARPATSPSAGSRAAAPPRTRWSA